MDDYDFQETVAVARLSTLATLHQAAQAETGRKAAIAKIEETNHGFQAFYGSDAYRQVLESHPKLGEAVLMAEATPSVQQSHLPDLYATVWDCAVAKGAQPQPQSRQAQTTPLRSETTSSGLTESEIFSATEQSKRADLSSKNRRALIEQLESSGVADVEF